MDKLDIGDGLIHKYNVLAPRYTSYPTAPQFHSAFDESDYQRHAAVSNDSLLPKDLSIYVHIPFCHSLCYFCGCNKVVTQVNNKKVAVYLERLLSEIAMRSKLFNDDRLVTQIHFGGGTPNFLKPQQLAEILEYIASYFHIDLPHNLEISIEVDPRAITPEGIYELAKTGFNRFSIGVQDFAEDVQKAINRQQAKSDTLATIAAAIAISNSVNVDLITGLPHQTPEHFKDTLSEIVDTGVTRIAAYSFAYMPERIKAQKMLNPDTLPDPLERLAIANLSRTTLLEAGYQHVGLDHYALPQDSLVEALNNNTLQRNFQGYTTHRDTDVIGIGASAISKFDSAFAQNATSLSSYCEMVDDNIVPIVKGISLNNDDRLRAELIQQIMCRNKIDLQQKISRYSETSQNLSLADYFSKELGNLQSFVDDDLLKFTERGFDISTKGRYFSRQIAATFDRYLTHPDRSGNGGVVQFSRSV